jgi:dynein heavy chain
MRCCVHGRALRTRATQRCACLRRCWVQVHPQALGAADVLAPLPEGVYVHGLWLQGARWDAAGGCLADAQPGVMLAPLPVLHLRAVAGHAPRAASCCYQCPLYQTSARAASAAVAAGGAGVAAGVAGGPAPTSSGSGSYVCSVPLRSPPSHPGGVDAWAVQGVALLLQADDG